MALTIVFDATPFVKDRPSGAGRYVTNFLFAMGELDHENRYEIFGFEPEIPGMKSWPSNFEYHHLPLHGFLGPFAREFARRKFVAARCKVGDVDIVQSNLDPVHVPRNSAGTILMLYDVMRAGAPYKSFVKQSLRDRARTYMRYARAKLADHLLTISEYSKSEIVNLLDVPPEKITVTHLAAEDVFTPGEPIVDILNGLDVKPPFVLFVGEFGRQKNEVSLIRAFLTAAKNNRIPQNVSLVMVGNRANLPKDFAGMVGVHSQGKRVRFVGTVDEQSLATLYRSAMAFVLPSLVEGFGLPALEAMSCGCPVIVSNVSSLPEVVGDAGIVVNPESDDEIENALAKICSDKDLRSRLSKAGIVRARAFSFKTVAETTLKLYRSLK